MRPGRTRSQPTLMDILRPRAFRDNAKRAAVTRTIVQPDIDKFEAMLESVANHAAAPAGALVNTSASASATP